MEPLVSVIIPVYNVLPYLREALDSVVRQTYRNLEILIVGDGSTDGSGNVCDEYPSDSRVRVIHQRHRGLSGARNAGLDVFRGLYVAFLDSDDAFDPAMVETMVNSLLDSDADLIVCGYRTCHTEGRLLPGTNGRCFEKALISETDAQRRLFLGGMYYAVWNKLYCRKLWDEIRFPEDRVFEDVPVMFRVFGRCRKVLLLPDLLVAYRIRSGSICQTVSPKIIRDFMDSEQLRRSQVEEHIPGLFTAEEGIRFRKIQLRSIILWYAQWLSSSSGKDGKDALREMREKIGQVIKQVRVHGMSTKTRMLVWLFRLCPRAILPLSAAVRGIRRLAGGNP